MKQANRLFIDECGYTGEDLFNEDQPVFVLASFYLPEEHCVELKNKYFSKVNAKELKHSRLSKYPAQQNMIIDFLRNMAKESDSIKFAIAHKHYVLVTKIVDLLIEPMAHEDGLDFYQEGLNIAFSNMLYLQIPQLAGGKFFKKMLLSFQQMMRERTYSAYEAFFRPLCENKFHKYLDEFFIFFKAHHVRYGPNFLRTIPKESLEIAFAEAFNLVAEWSKFIQGNFSLIHDKSSNMAKNKKAWDKVLHPDVPPKVVGYDRRKMYFPIRAEKTDFESSHDFAGLQLVDILAGAMARCMKWNIQGKEYQDNYAKELSSFLPESFGGHMLWPSSKVTPEELGTNGPKAEDAIQHFIDLTRDIS